MKKALTKDIPPQHNDELSGNVVNGTNGSFDRNSKPDLRSNLGPKFLGEDRTTSPGYSRSVPAGQHRPTA